MINPSEKHADRFRDRYKPSAMKKVIQIVEREALKAAVSAADMYPNGNFAQTQGNMRRQGIFEGLKTLDYPGFTAETYSYSGYRLTGEERVPNFTVLVSHHDTALLIARTNDRYERQPTIIGRYISQRNTSLKNLFDEDEMFLRSDLNHLERFYLVGYDLEPEDASGAAVSNIQILIQIGKERQNQVLIPDARAYSLQSDPITGPQVPDVEEEQLVQLRPNETINEVEDVYDDTVSTDKHDADA
jgi:hypothetical protein